MNTGTDTNATAPPGAFVRHCKVCGAPYFTSALRNDEQVQLVYELPCGHSVRVVK